MFVCHFCIYGIFPSCFVLTGFILGESTLITADIPVYDPFGVYNTYQPTLGQQIKDIPDNRQSSSPASLPSNTSSASRPSPLSVTPGHTDTMITKTGMLNNTCSTD